LELYHQLAISSAGANQGDLASEKVRDDLYRTQVSATEDWGEGHRLLHGFALSLDGAQGFDHDL
jgi:hypothetical protein